MGGNSVLFGVGDKVVDFGWIDFGVNVIRSGYFIYYVMIVG